jgi:FAD binding domain
MAPPTVDDIVMLEMTIRGRVVVPQNTLEYESAIKKNHNAGFHDRKPTLFILCKDTADVQAALQFTTRHELPICVRSGGHSACGSSLREGTVVIDLGGIDHVDYVRNNQSLSQGPVNCAHLLFSSLVRRTLQRKKQPLVPVPHSRVSTYISCATAA